MSRPTVEMKAAREKMAVGDERSRSPGLYSVLSGLRHYRSSRYNVPLSCSRAISVSE
jgi:hypothetical protein